MNFKLTQSQILFECITRLMPLLHHTLPRFSMYLNSCCIIYFDLKSEFIELKEKFWYIMYYIVIMIGSK